MVNAVAAARAKIAVGHFALGAMLAPVLELFGVNKKVLRIENTDNRKRALRMFLTAFAVTDNLSNKGRRYVIDNAAAITTALDGKHRITPF